jgi:ATP-dependent Clp protease protease subunit
VKFWNFIKNTDETTGSSSVELRIDGDIKMEEDFWDMLFGIESFNAKGFMADLKQYSGQDLTVWINSYGGDVYAASCIYTALKEHQGNVTAKIDGVAMSAASVIAMAADDLCMSPTAIMMIHNPWIGGIQGESGDLRKYANMLDEVKATIINAYQLKTGKSENEISSLMDQETYMGAKKALSEGFIDKILYQDDGQEEDTISSFAFSGFRVQNTISQSTKEFFNEYLKRSKQLNKNNNPQVPVNKTEKNVDFDLYKQIILNNERRKKLWS